MHDHQSSATGSVRLFAIRRSDASFVGPDEVSLRKGGPHLSQQVRPASPVFVRRAPPGRLSADVATLLTNAGQPRR